MDFRRRIGAKPYGDRAEIVRKSCLGRLRGDGTVTVRSSCSFGHLCIKSDKLHISACVSIGMEPKTKGKESKKENVDPAHGGHTVMMRLP